MEGRAFGAVTGILTLIKIALFGNGSGGKCLDRYK